MINQLDYRHGETFSGVFRIHRPEIKTARNNSKYISCSLLDRSGEIPAYGWLDRYTGDTGFTEMEKIRAQGRLRWFAGQWVADLEQGLRHSEKLENPLELIPDKACPSQTGFAKLEDLLEGLENEHLKQTLVSIINNDRLVLPFISLPASRQNHHAYPGGLLEHSLECAEFVGHFNQQGNDIRELGIVAALLHDIGKVRTIERSGDGTAISGMLKHDLLTLELLAEPLSALDREWRDGGTALRYLLCWKLQARYGTKPLMVVSELIQAADRFSSGIDNEKALFMEMPAWRQFVSDGNGRRAWRPKAVHSK